MSVKVKDKKFRKSPSARMVSEEVQKVVKAVPKTKYDEWKLFFDGVDTNGDSLISVQEWRQALEKLEKRPVSEAEAAEMVDRADLNRDGYLDFAEFVAVMVQGDTAPTSKEAGATGRRSKSPRPKSPRPKSPRPQSPAAAEKDKIKNTPSEPASSSGHQGHDAGAGAKKTDHTAFIRRQFEIFDLNGNGTISREELKTSMADLGIVLSDDEVDSMIQDADLNKDGKIDYNEFLIYYQKIAP